MSELPAILG
jgi:hypothetical protein